MMKSYYRIIAIIAGSMVVVGVGVLMIPPETHRSANLSSLAFG
jgi:hypothetical protein